MVRGQLNKGHHDLALHVPNFETGRMAYCEMTLSARADHRSKMQPT